jgi:hypothetical protein
MVGNARRALRGRQLLPGCLQVGSTWRRWVDSVGCHPTLAVLAGALGKVVVQGQSSDLQEYDRPAGATRARSQPVSPTVPNPTGAHETEVAVVTPSGSPLVTYGQTRLKVGVLGGRATPCTHVEVPPASPCVQQTAAPWSGPTRFP